MVGTSPTRSPRALQAREKARGSSVRRRTCIVVLCAEAPGLIGGEVEGLLLGGEPAAENVLAEPGERLAHLLAEVAVGPDEPRQGTVVETEHVVEDQHLSVAVGTGANADREDARALRDGLGHFAGDALEDHAE